MNVAPFHLNHLAALNKVVLLRRSKIRPRRCQRGVMAIEYALVFIFGILPLLLLTFSGVLIFAAKQSLTLAADNGARAALRFSGDGSIADRSVVACKVAEKSMQWLLNFSGQTPDCSAANSGGGPIMVTSAACSGAMVSCIRVVTSFDYNDHPFIPGTQTAYGWVMKGNLESEAVVQLDVVDSSGT